MSSSLQKGKAFEEEVAALFKLMGYSIESNTLINAGQIDIRVEIKLGLVTQKGIIECKNYAGTNVGIEDVEKFCNRISLARQKGQTDFGMLISNTDFSPQAKLCATGYGFVQLKTYRQLLSQLIDFEAYLKNFVYDFEHYDEYSNGQRKPILDILSRCDLKRYYIDLKCEDSFGAEPVSIDTFFEKWLDDQNRNQVTLLGDYGTGKSSVALYLTYKLAKKYLEDPVNNRIPLFVSLRDYSKAINIQQLITDLLINHYGVQIQGFGVFQKFVETGKMVLIFDGFDEMATKVDKKTTIENFNELSTVVTANSKTILTCRTHYFRSQSQVFDLFSPANETELMLELKKRNNFEVIELQELDNPQVISLLQKRTDNWKFYWDKIRSIYNLEDLARRPILLDMITKSLPSLISKKSEIDQAILYDEYTRFWIEREDWRSQMSKEEKALFMENLAFQMFTTDLEWVHFRKLCEIVKNEFKSQIITCSDVDYFDNDTRTCSFLNRDSQGNYKFIHRSFMEFFVAKKISEELIQNVTDSFKEKFFSPEVFDFIVSLIKANVKAKKTLEDTIFYLNQQKSENYGFTAANIITLLNYLNVDLTGKDFSGLTLPFADLSGTSLKGSIFVNAKLQNANLDGTDLTGADFSFADLSNVSIAASNPCTALSYSPDGKKLAIGDSGGILKIWDVNRSSIIRIIQDHDNQIFALSFSPDSRYIATGGCDRALIIREAKNGQLISKSGIDTSIIWKVAYTSDGTKIIAVGSDGYVRMLDSKSGASEKRRLNVEDGKDSIWAIGCQPQGKCIAIGGPTKDIYIRSLPDYTLVSVLHGHLDCIQDLSFSTDGKLIVSVSKDKQLKMWDRETNEVKWTVNGVTSYESVSVSPHLDRVAVAGNDKIPRIFDLKTGEEIMALQGHSDIVNCVTFSPDGEQVATASYDTTVKVWSANGECILTIGKKPSCRHMKIEGVIGLIGQQIADLISRGATGNPVRFKPQNETRSMPIDEISRRKSETAMSRASNFYEKIKKR